METSTIDASPKPPVGEGGEIAIIDVELDSIGSTTTVEVPTENLTLIKLLAESKLDPVMVTLVDPAALPLFGAMPETAAIPW